MGLSSASKAQLKKNPGKYIERNQGRRATAGSKLLAFMKNLGGSKTTYVRDPELDRKHNNAPKKSNYKIPSEPSNGRGVGF